MKRIWLLTFIADQNECTISSFLSVRKHDNNLVAIFRFDEHPSTAANLVDIVKADTFWIWNGELYLAGSISLTNIS